MFLDTSIWDPGADDSSKVSAQEDIVAHIGYNIIQREIVIGEDVQSLTGGPSSTMDRGQFSALSFAESVVGDSNVDTSSEGHEVAPQHDCDQESHYLAEQLRVNEDMIMAATRRIDDTHVLVVDCCWRASWAHDISDEGSAMDDFHTLRERMTMTRGDHQQLLMERDYLLEVSEMYHRALREQELEVDKLTHELESTQGFLRGTQTSLQESNSRSEEILEEIRQRSTTSILMEAQIYHSVTLLEDVGGLAEEHEEYPGSLVSMESYDPEAQELPSTRIFETVEHSHMHGDSKARGSFEDTSICVPGAIDLHVEVDPVLHPGSMMLQEYTGDYMSMQEHTVVSDSSQRHADMYSGVRRGVLACREETHLVEHGDVSPWKQHIVLGDPLHISRSHRGDHDWDSVMIIGEYAPWVPMDELLVESLGLTKAYDTFQSYSQPHMFQLAFLDTLIIDSGMRRDRQW
jgi:hypothetical protein